MQYTFRQVDPTKKNKQKGLWIEQIPIGDKKEKKKFLTKKINNRTSRPI